MVINAQKIFKSYVRNRKTCKNSVENEALVLSKITLKTSGLKFYGVKMVTVNF